MVNVNKLKQSGVVIAFVAPIFQDRKQEAHE